MNFSKEEIQSNINIIYEFFSNFDICGVVTEDFLFDFEDFVDKWGYTGDESWDDYPEGYKIPCVICTTKYEPNYNINVKALICSDDCFVRYYKTNDSFREEVKKLYGVLEKMSPFLKSIYDEIEEKLEEIYDRVMKDKTSEKDFFPDKKYVHQRNVFLNNLEKDKKLIYDFAKEEDSGIEQLEYLFNFLNKII